MVPGERGLRLIAQVRPPSPRPLESKVLAPGGARRHLLTLHRTLVRLDRTLQVIEPPERLDDGLPITTA